MAKTTTKVITTLSVNPSKVLAKMSRCSQKGFVELPERLEYVGDENGWRCSPFRATGWSGQPVFYKPPTDRWYRKRKYAKAAAYHSLLVEFELDAGLGTEPKGQNACAMCEKHEEHIQMLKAEIKELYKENDYLRDIIF